MNLLFGLLTILCLVCYVKCGEDVVIDVEANLDVGQKLQDDQKVFFFFF